MRVLWEGCAGPAIGRLIRRGRLPQAFVCAVCGAQSRTGGKLGCAVVRHS
jgi:hypothetical protein